MWFLKRLALRVSAETTLTTSRENRPLPKMKAALLTLPKIQNRVSAVSAPLIDALEYSRNPHTVEQHARNRRDIARHLLMSQVGIDFVLSESAINLACIREWHRMWLLVHGDSEGRWAPGRATVKDSDTVVGRLFSVLTSDAFVCVLRCIAVVPTQEAQEAHVRATDFDTMLTPKRLRRN